MISGDVARLSMLCYGDADLLDDPFLRGKILEKMRTYSFGGNILLKNLDDIYREKNTLIMVPTNPRAENEIERRISHLYPDKKCYYLALEGIKLEDRTYFVPLQVGFATKRTYFLRDTLPILERRIAKAEKSLIFPAMQDTLRNMCPESRQPQGEEQ